MSTKLLSIILLSYFSKKNINAVYKEARRILDIENINFEFIIMDDGSTDESFKVAEELEQKENNVKAFQLSRNYTSDYSIFAAYTVTSGDCVVYIPDDGQPDIKYLVNMYREWENGTKIVFLKRSKRNDPVLSIFFALTFYKIMERLADVKYPPGGIEIALIDREIVQLINQRIHPINTAIHAELIRMGYNPVYIKYERPKSNRKKSRWTLKKKIRLAKNIFFSSSSVLIKLISYMGIFFTGFSIIILILYSYINIWGNKNFWGYIPPGWTSTVLFISFFSGLILFSLGIIAEYIWRIYEEVKDRPGYIIKKKK